MLSSVMGRVNGFDERKEREGGDGGQVKQKAKIKVEVKVEVKSMLKPGCG
ncbi:MAG: hypothetical protein PHW14_06735 [Candidatus Omnitrophica bacterium]|nr:hypothetical protein [Candidatus Omnitrophota bacterium]